MSLPQASLALRTFWSTKANKQGCGELLVGKLNLCM